MLARTGTVLGLLLLLTAMPVQAAMPAAPDPNIGVFLGTARLYSPAHRTLGTRSLTRPGTGRDGADQEAFLEAMLPVFGPDLARRIATEPCAAAYVPASAIGGLSPLVSGSGPDLAWSRFAPTPVQQVLDLLIERQPVPAIMIGASGMGMVGLRTVDLKVATGNGDLFGPDSAGVFVTDLNLRARNATDEATGIAPPALMLVGIGMVCLAPGARRRRPQRARVGPVAQAAVGSVRSRKR
jgi:hypothetical protein